MHLLQLLTHQYYNTTYNNSNYDGPVTGRDVCIEGKVKGPIRVWDNFQPFRSRVGSSKTLPERERVLSGQLPGQFDNLTFRGRIRFDFCQ